MSEIFQKVIESVDFITRIIGMKPKIGIILGTGLGQLADYIEKEKIIDYEVIPNFPVSTVEFHHGKMIFGKISGKEVVAMQGRFHLYEGYSMQQITFPVRVMKNLGVEILIVSNACGSVNPLLPKGSLMIIEDHINLLPGNPLIGVNDPELGERFVDMSEPYSKQIIEIVERIALDKKIKIFKGVYAAMSGPSLETRAEYRFLRTIGADVVGMSTVPENIVARQCGMKVLGLSITTDECYPDALKPVGIDEILETASKVEPNLTELVKEFVKII